MRNAAARRKEQDIDGGVDSAGSNTAVWSSRAKALLVPQALANVRLVLMYFPPT
jgi:hypothetical protein